MKKPKPKHKPSKNADGVPYGHPPMVLRIPKPIVEAIDEKVGQIGLSRRAYIEQLIRQDLGMPTINIAKTIEPDTGSDLFA